MHKTHKIKLDPTFKQAEYFRRAAGTCRFVWNYALAEWNRKYAAGDKPSGSSLRKEFNAVYRVLFPWIGEVHRDCHSQPFADLQKAWGNFFKGLAEKPSFKKKGKDRPSFYVANDETVSNREIALRQAKDAASRGHDLAGMLVELESLGSGLYLGLESDPDDSDLDVWP